MLAGLVLMVGEYWFAVSVGARHSIPASHRVLEWIIIIYGAYLASPPVGR
jgi:hypothetical protein